MSQVPPADDSVPVTPRGSAHAWRALLVLLLGMFMALLDTTIVNVALPTIRSSLGAGEDTLSWIISGYALAFGIALIPAGRIGDRIGHKWVFFTGLALFTLASVACGLAVTDLQLIIFRVTQGLAGGIFVPAVTAFIQLLFAPRERGKAFAVVGATIGVSAALGPLFGGLLIQAFGETNGWRLVFGVNLPIGIIALVAAVILLPNRAQIPGAPAPVRGALDGIGLLLVAAGLVAILVPLIEGQDKGWPLWTYLTLGAGVVVLALFALWEVRYSGRGGFPLVPPKLFTNAAFTGGTILALVYFAAFTAIFFSLSILWQTGLGRSALEAGFVSVPFATGSIISSLQSNRLAARLGRTVLVWGTGLLVVGLSALWIILLTVPGDQLTTWTVLGPLFVAGVGNGLFVAPNVQFIVATVDRSAAGAASGVIATMQRIGSAVGIAVVGSVLFGTANPAGIRSVADRITSFTAGAGAALGVSVLLAVIAFALVFVLPRRLSRGE